LLRLKDNWQEVLLSGLPSAEPEQESHRQLPIPQKQQPLALTPAMIRLPAMVIR
jgi:hypothetical protein